MTPAAKHLRNLTRIVCGSLSETGSVGDTATRLKVSEKVVKDCVLQADRVSLLRSSYVKRVIKNPSLLKQVLKNLVSKNRQANDARKNETPYELLNVSFDQAVKLKQVYSLYQELGTLDSVGQRLGVTRERVRQLLRKGAVAGLFDYETTSKRKVKQLSQRLDKRTLALALERSNVHEVAREYGTSDTVIIKLCEANQLETKELRLHARKQRCLTEYMDVVEGLGKHPSTFELQRQPNGRALYNRMTALWGSFPNFRKAYGITFERKANTWSKGYFSSALAASQQERTEKVKTFLTYIEQNPGVTVSKACTDLGIKRPTLYEYLKEQERLGKIEVKRTNHIGQPSLLYATQREVGGVPK